MNQINKITLLYNIKWMCYDIYITSNNEVFSLSLKQRFEKLKGGSYCYYCHEQYRSKKWIKKNCVNIGGYITL